MAYVFLSYAKSDRDTAFAIRDLLEEAGFSVWLDKNRSELKAWHWHKIQANIREAGALVVLVSDAAKQSAWLKRELDFAESLQKPLFPVLIQGAGWSRLGTKLEKLRFGLKLELPISLLENLQTALETAPKSPLPQQIELNPYPQGVNKRTLAITIGGLILATLLFLVLISPLIIRELTPSPPQLTRQALEGTSAASVRSRSTAIAQITGTARAQSQRENTEWAIIRQGELTTTAQERALLVNTQIARTAVFATQNALNAVATSAYEANMNATAVAGNGVLPCTALVRYSAEQTHFLYYRQAEADALTWQVNIPRSGLNLILGEWLVNEEGVWYRVTNESGLKIAYVRAEDIVLGADCPR